MMKTTVTALSIAALAAATTALPAAAADTSKAASVQIAACSPCKAKKGCNPCNPCAAKKNACKNAKGKSYKWVTGSGCVQWCPRDEEEHVGQLGHGGEAAHFALEAI